VGRDQPPDPDLGQVEEVVDEGAEPPGVVPAMLDPDQAPVAR
jgi:hypothetical protein